MKISSSATLATFLTLFFAIVLRPDSAAADPTWTDAYDGLLRTHVDEQGFVDYAAIAAEPQVLTGYVESLALPDALPPVDQRDARLAALINAYNAFTLQLILDHWDQFESGAVSSITELHGGKPWDQDIWTLAGQTVSLNQLEHELIRRDLLTLDGVPGAAEPRLHWAVVCAAYSCPPLRAEAYTAPQLEAQLADQERRVLLTQDPRFVQQDGGKIGVTQLFNWYGKDFGDWKRYVTQRLEPAPAATNWYFINYDWKLNAQSNKTP
ncbi:MAG: DUF547 domain-containing protein [Planctomycetota bacterium]